MEGGDKTGRPGEQWREGTRQAGQESDDETFTPGLHQLQCLLEGESLHPP